ncbi:MAG: pseudoazurin [Rhizobiales bacterium]|nr:pseudoazurin [Hyphomicrobiales bacterium]
MRSQIIGLTVALVTTIASPAFAEEFEIKMLNKGEAGSMVFEPSFIKAAVGDTVKFIPENKGHNAESIKGMLPEGFKKFKSKFNKEYVLTLTSEGVYGIKCSPHYSMGMVALIVAGEPVNLEKAMKAKKNKKSKERFAKAFAELSQ